MSLGKLPVISWVSGSHTKRRLKAELTPDMISPPLGDFRHTMHVGRGGDAFGDTSFLRNHGGDVAKHNNFFARTLRHVRRSPLRNGGSRNKTKDSPSPPAVSPIIKNAVSLPQLNEGNYGSDSLGSMLTFKSSPNSFSDYGLESGFCTIPRIPRSEKTQESSYPAAESALTRSDSLLSFRLDLGPSLMSELLHVISFSGDSREEEKEESKSPPDSDTISPLRQNSSYVKDSSPWRSGSPKADDEENKVVPSFWGHSGTGSSFGHSVCTNGGSDSQEGSPCSRGKNPSPGLGTGPKETPWQEYQNACNRGGRESNRAGQVSASHYGPGEAYNDPCQHEESRSQVSWESPDVNRWHSKVQVAEQHCHKMGWCPQAEEEEEEEQFLGNGTTAAREGHSDSFDFVDEEEEEEDEVKV